MNEKKNKKKLLRKMVKEKEKNEGQKCEHGGKEGPEKYSNSTNPHICERNLDLE